MTRLALVVALAASAPVLAADRTARPNIIFILADDLGWTDLGCQGSKYYQSPNIDRLAKEGMRFTSGYTCGPNCQPTRAALITGQYGPRTGVYTVGSIDRFAWQTRPLRPVDNVTQLALKKVTLAESMKKAGYATALFGKWHLGQADRHHPARRGFDEAIVSMGKHYDFTTSPKVEYPKGTYFADFLTDRALGFIAKNKERPFFLCLHHFAVHSPHQAKPDLVKKFKGREPSGGHRDPTYAAMIASVDDSVGRVLKALNDHKLADNTLVVFTSDNGGVGGYAREGLTRAGGITDNAPLRGGKGMLYEGGVRVPFLFRWKGTIPGGKVVDAPLTSVDLFPTFVDLGGGKLPAAKDHPIDGVSFKHCLMSGPPPKRDAIYWHFPGYLGAGKGGWRTTPAGAVRSGDYKLVEFFETRRAELYNLKDDIGEKKDLAMSRPEILKELQAKLTAWRKAVQAPMPTPNQGRE